MFLKKHLFEIVLVLITIIIVVFLVYFLYKVYNYIINLTPIDKPVSPVTDETIVDETTEEVEYPEPNDSDNWSVGGDTTEGGVGEVGSDKPTPLDEVEEKPPLLDRETWNREVVIILAFNFIFFFGIIATTYLVSDETLAQCW